MVVNCTSNDKKIYIQVLTNWRKSQAKGVFFCFEGNVVVVEIVVIVGGNDEVWGVEPRDYSTKNSG